MSAMISLVPEDTSWKYAGTLEDLPAAIKDGSVSRCCSCARTVIRPCVTQATDAKRGGDSLHLFCPHHRNTRCCAHVGKCQDDVKFFVPRRCKACREVIPAMSGYVKARHFHLALNGGMPWRDVSELCQHCGDEHVAQASAEPPNAMGDWHPDQSKYQPAAL